MVADPNLQADLKVRYGPFENPLPEDDQITKFAKFVAKESRNGRTYNFPVQMTLEHGQTADVSGTAYALNAAIPALVLEATLDGFDYTHIAEVAYSSLLRGSNGAVPTGGDAAAAFWEPFDLKVDNMMQAANLYRELWTLYGCGTTGTIYPGCNIGVINALIAGTNYGTAGGATVSIQKQTWIPGLWHSMINAKLDVYNAGGTATVETGVSVLAVNADLAQIKLFKTSSAVVPALNTQLVPFGWGVKTCVGLQGILSNQTSLFGIDAAIYPQWKAVTFNVGTAANAPAQLTAAHIQRLAARLFPNGLRGGATLFVCPMTFADLSNETGDDQIWQNDSPSRTQGVEENGLKFRTCVGVVKVQVCALMKQGFAFMFGEGLVKRIGASDITFRAKGSQDWFHNELPQNAGSQLRCISNQAPCVTIPYRCALMQYIGNSGDVGPTPA